MPVLRFSVSAFDLNGLTAAEIPDDPEIQVDTVFLGGGTPSLLTPDQLERILTAVRESYRVQDGAEISMEVNPGTADLERLQAYRGAGINRLSIGVQSTRNWPCWAGSTGPARRKRSSGKPAGRGLTISIST